MRDWPKALNIIALNDTLILYYNINKQKYVS